MGKVVVGSRVEARDAFTDGVPSREHEHRDGIAPRPQLAAEPAAVAIGQTEVEDDERIRGFAQQVAGRGEVVSKVDRVTFLHEPALEHARQGPFIFDDKDSHGLRAVSHVRDEGAMKPARSPAELHRGFTVVSIPFTSMADPTAAALVAHVLRRLTFGPSEEQVTRFSTGASDPRAAAAAAVDWALAAKPRPIAPDTLGEDGADASLRGWVDNMRSPDAGVHEKMTWFWHGHFATSSEKVGNLALMHAQQRLFRTHAMGNFATMLHAIVRDAAMLLYLDAAGSSVEAPNENLARELMELFSLGRGNYTEADVKAGALALAGWDVDYDTGKVTRDPEASLGGEVVFLGRRGRLDATDMVDTILSRPACAVFVASRIHTYLVGVAPAKARAEQLGSVLRAAEYEIRPLVEAIVRHDDFIGTRMNRPRFAIEWFIAAVLALGPPREGAKEELDVWTLEDLDQLPYRPPNVAGWPPGAKWLGAGQQLTRSAYVWDASWRMRPIEGRDLVGAALRRASLHDVSPATRAALQDAAIATAGSADSLSVSRRLMAAALCSPEFALA